MFVNQEKNCPLKELKLSNTKIRLLHIATEQNALIVATGELTRGQRTATGLKIRLEHVYLRKEGDNLEQTCKCKKEKK